MNKLVFLAVSILSFNFAFAGSIKEVRTAKEARIHLGLEKGSDGLLSGQDALMKKVQTDLAEIDKDKKAKYVPINRMSGVEKTAVSNALNIMANEAQVRIVNIDGLAEAIAKRSELLVTVTILISKGKGELLEMIATQASRDGIDLAAISKLVELSTNESGSVDAKLKTISESVLRELAGGSKDPILTILQRNGYKSKKIEDFIIC